MKTGRVNTVTFYVYVSKPEIRTIQLQVYGDIVYALAGSPADAAAFRNCEGNPSMFDGDRIRKAVAKRLMKSKTTHGWRHRKERSS